MNNRSTIPPDGSPTEARRPKRWQHAQGRRLALASLVSVILLATLWSVASVSGAGFFGGDKVREARAQTPGGDQQQIRQDDPVGGGSQQNGASQDNSPQNGDSNTAGYNEEAYAAFGERHNPFVSVVSDDDENVGNGDNQNQTQQGGSDAGSAGDRDDDGNGGSSAEEQETNLPENQSNTNDDNASQNGQNGDLTGKDTATVPSGEQVDCSDTEPGFARLTCEEERQADASDSGDGTQVPEDRGGQRERVEPQGPPGSGGSGRSGAGEPSEDFRNGGGGASK